MTQINRDSQAQDEALGAFYNEWPELKDPKLEATIVQIAQSYRQANPNASLEDSIQEVGVSAWLASGRSAQELIARAQGQGGGADEVVTPAATPATVSQPMPSTPLNPTVQGDVPRENLSQVEQILNDFAEEILN